MSEELHEELRAAFEAANAAEAERDTTVLESGASTDDAGAADEPEKAPEKVVKKAEGEVKAEAQDDPAKSAEEPPAEGVKLDKARAPTSWNAKVREKWTELPEEVRQEVIKREEAHINGVRKLQDEFAPVRQFAESVGGVLQEARQLGQDPVQYIHNLAAAERGLRSGSPDQKFGVLLQLADQYGIPLRQFLGTDAPAQQPQAAQIPAEVARELEESRRFREQMAQQQQVNQQTQVQRQVEEFKRDREFFEDVRETMAGLFESNQVSTLEEAYEKAIWMNPDVRAVLLQREKAQQGQEQHKQRQLAAAGASGRQGTADVNSGVDFEDEDSIEATIRKSIVASSGRV